MKYTEFPNATIREDDDTPTARPPLAINPLPAAIGATQCFMMAYLTYVATQTLAVKVCVPECL
jgi:hypothetical protein